MKRRRRPFGKRRHIGRLFCITAVLLAAGILVMNRQIQPLLQQYGSTQAEWHATRLINEAVSAVLETNRPSYEELITVTRDTAGNVTSAEADIRALNSLKAAVSTAVAEKIGEKREIAVEIPLGAFSGVPLFAGRGPVISVPVSVAGSAVTDVASSFTAAGVNQTAHRIDLTICARLFIGMPGAYTDVNVETSFIIAESVLLGKVPDAYTVVTGDDQSTTGKIFDYRSENQN